jgi:uncharacterized membrane protein
MKLRVVLQMEWLQVLILVIPFAFIPFIWTQLPDRIPIHWDYNGHANGFSTKTIGLLLLPIINIGLAALLFFLSKVDPKAWMMNVPSVSMRPIRLAITGFLLVIYLGTTLSMVGLNIPINAIFQGALPLLFLLLGNYLPRIKPNYFVGVRVPWTLEDPDNWRQTHHFAGRLWVILSLIYLVILIAQHGTMPMWAFVAYLVIVTLAPIVYSFLLFHRRK